MIFLDGERFIDDAISSVVSQQGLADWELILVDDGSGDASTSIAQRWARADPDRIRYVDHPGHENRGMSASRNRGIETATGDLIGFLDCDDILLPRTMARAIEMFDRHPHAEAVIGRYVMWYGWTSDPRDRCRDWLYAHPPGLPRDELLTAPQLFHGMYGSPERWITPGVCSLVVRRDVALRLGGFEPRFRTLYEDHVFYAKLGLGADVVLDDRPYALYRQHQWSACAGDRWRTVLTPWRRDPFQYEFLSWLQGHVRRVPHAGPAEMGVVEANLVRRTVPVGGVREFGRNLRIEVMGSAPPPVTDALRRVRAAVKGGNLGRDELPMDLRATIDGWCRQLRRPGLPQA